MSDAQNTYSSSNLYPFLSWATSNGAGSNSNWGPDDLNNISNDGRKKIKQLFVDLPKALEESNKSYLGLTRRNNTKSF